MDVEVATKMVRLVLSGNPGCGKSATGNMLVAAEVFQFGGHASPITAAAATVPCPVGSATPCGADHVTDVPGLIEVNEENMTRN